MTDYLTNDTDLTSVANAIRSKAGLSVTLEFPSDFVSAIASIPTGITPTGTINITQNGTVDVTNYASANVSVSSGVATAKSGEFTATSTGALTIDTGYTGNGFPLAYAIVLMGDVSSNTKTAGYSIYIKIKVNPEPPSTYDSQELTFGVRCGGTGSSGQTVNKHTAAMFYQGDPLNNANLCVFMSDKSTLKVYCGDSATSFRTNVRYGWAVFYSS